MCVYTHMSMCTFQSGSQLQYVSGTGMKKTGS